MDFDFEGTAPPSGTAIVLTPEPSMALYYSHAPTTFAGIQDLVEVVYEFLNPLQVLRVSPVSHCWRGAAKAYFPEHFLDLVCVSNGINPGSNVNPDDLALKESADTCAVACPTRADILECDALGTSSKNYLSMEAKANFVAGVLIFFVILVVLALLPLAVCEPKPGFCDPFIGVLVVVLAGGLLVLIATFAVFPLCRGGHCIKHWLFQCYRWSLICLAIIGLIFCALWLVPAILFKEGSSKSQTTAKVALGIMVIGVLVCFALGFNLEIRFHFCPMCLRPGTQSPNNKFTTSRHASMRNSESHGPYLSLQEYKLNRLMPCLNSLERSARGLEYRQELFAGRAQRELHAER